MVNTMVLLKIFHLFGDVLTNCHEKPSSSGSIKYPEQHDIVENEIESNFDGYFSVFVGNFQLVSESNVTQYSKVSCLISHHLMEFSSNPGAAKHF